MELVERHRAPVLDFRYRLAVSMAVSMGEVSSSAASRSGSGHLLEMFAGSTAVVMLKRDPRHMCPGRLVIVSVAKLLAS